MAHAPQRSTVLRSACLAAGLLALVVLLAAGSACGRGKTDQRAASAVRVDGPAFPAGASPLGYCSVTVTGAQATSFVVPADEADFDTDYWRTDAEARELIRGVLRFDEYRVYEEDEEYLTEQAMARDPRLTLFVMDCNGEQGGVTLVPGKFSRYADVPFRPNTYEIAPAANMEAVTEGVFLATISVGSGAASRDYTVVEPGVLNITVFNELQIAGTFTFKATSADGQVIVMQGKFDYRKPKEEVLD
jgi:hypothetical protein